MTEQDWKHPAGFLDIATLGEIEGKIDSLDWAKKVIEDLDADAQPWLSQPLPRLEQLMPKRKMQVYWLLVCPECTTRLTFDPFNDQEARCPDCRKSFSLDQESVALHSKGKYAGTLYEGWGCSYIQAMANMAKQLAFLYALGADRTYAERSAAIIKLFAKYVQTLPVQGGGTQYVIWTYNMEGDCVIVLALSEAYELLRSTDGLFTTSEHRDIQDDLLKYWSDSVFRVEEDSSPRHNGMYSYLSSVAMVGCAIESTDYIDWAFGYRDYSTEKRPDHHSLSWLTTNNYLQDGAFWGLCSAYHLYALGPNCRVLVLGHRLSNQMPDLFPPEMYDELHIENPRSQVLRRAVKWFTSQTFPDLTVAPTGDMGGRVGLNSYPLTAEIGYRYLGVDEVGSYRDLREGDRGMIGLLYGADTIEETPVPWVSTYLTSGYVSLKRESDGNRQYAGLNVLQPGSGHAHGDRLNLITYSHDRMLTGEKVTRYEYPDQRTYSGASYGHNTVTVDETSQVHGDALQGDRIPYVSTFVDLPSAQVTEARGDRIYEHTEIYRRTLCQFDGYLLDLFQVRGGEIHDWFYHGIGEEPAFTIPMEEKTDFEPALYVVRGGREFKEGNGEGTFSATWRITADPESPVVGRRRDVFSRVTLAGSPNQVAYLLDTYPNPGRHSLMVRHRESDTPFVAVHEAYHDHAIVTDLELLQRGPASVLRISHGDGSSRLIAFGSGTGPEDLVLVGSLVGLEFDATGKLRDLILIDGSEVQYGDLRMQTDRKTCLSVKFGQEDLTLTSSPSIGYETNSGECIYSKDQEVTVQLDLPAGLSPTGQRIAKELRVPGQTERGVVSVTVAW